MDKKERDIKDVPYEIRKGNIFSGKEMHYVFSKELKSIDPIHYGEMFEPHNTLFFSGMVYGLSKNFVMLDIGANIGYYSALCISQRPDAEIHAFEPNDIVFKALSLNAEGNNINAHHCGIGKETKRATLYCDNRNVGGHSFIDSQDSWGDHKGFQPDIGMYKIEADIKNIREFNIEWEKVNIIKLDTQGLELEILKDVFPLITDRCFFFIEDCSGLKEFADKNKMKLVYHIGIDNVYYKDKNEDIIN